MAELIGYQGVQARLRAISGPNFGPKLMKQLGVAANAEQKLILMPHNKTKTTSRSVHYSNVTATSVTTEAAAAARFLEFGTKPHVIRPKVARVLAWASGSAGGPNRRLSGATRKGVKPDHFAMSVHHPGTKASPFMVPGAKLAISKSGLTNLIVKLWNDAA